jgi:murein DD-endopeptidase MepM/ murein hydrolase activator NlpD
LPGFVALLSKESRLSFVMIAANARRGSRVRTLSAGRAAVAAACAALVLLGAGGALGYWLAAPAPAPAIANASAEPLVHPFTLAQIGALSARLFRLESQAAQLGRRIGLLPGTAAPAAAQDRTVPELPASSPGTDARGGPLLQPRPPPELDNLGAFDEQLERLEQQIDLVSDAAALRYAALMRLPSLQPVADGLLVSPFGNRSDPFTTRHAFHAGVDFAAPHGTPILAAAGGRIDVAGYRPDFGWMVEIEHGNGLRTRYAHASKLLVSSGVVVAPGERIALVGSSGRSTGPHLHFEVLRQGAAVDPRRYLAQR